MEFLAVLDVLVDVLDDIFGKRRSEQAAISEGAVAEFGAALAPSNNFVAIQKPRGFTDEFIFAGEVVIGDFAVVEDSFDFLGVGMHAEGKSGQRGTSGMAGSLLEREMSGAEGGAGIAGDGLDVDMVKATP